MRGAFKGCPSARPRYLQGHFEVSNTHLGFMRGKPNEGNMIKEKNNIGNVQTLFFTFAEGEQKLALESGRTLGPVTLAYETYGQLNTDKTNAFSMI